MSIFSVHSNNVIDRFKSEIGTSLIIAHRGYAKGMDFKRNTIPAFKHAVELGAHGLEIDLRLTKDGKVVIHHDPWVKHGAGLKLISKHSYDDLLEQVGSSEDLPLVQDVYPILPSNQPFFMQIKDPNSFPEICRQLLELKNLDSNIVLMGYVSAIYDNSLPTQFIYGKHYLIPSTTNLRYIENKQQANNNFCIASPWYALLNASHIEKIKKMGLQSVVYTVNNMKKVMKFKQTMVDAIYTDLTKEVLQNFY